MSADQTELVRLRAKPARVKMEGDILKKRRRTLRGIAVKYAWIAKNKDAWPITMTCDVHDVSASGYFAHQRRHQQGKPSRPGAARVGNEALLANIRANHAEVEHEFCSLRVWKELLPRRSA